MLDELTQSEIRLSPLADDHLAYLLITREDYRDLELDLFTSKWFDYRHMTPAQATRFYIEAYGEVFREFYAQEVNFEAAPHIHVMTVDRVMEGLGRRSDDGEGYSGVSGSAGAAKFKRFFVGAWRGRQFADAIGMPYRTYLNLAFKWRLKFWSQSFLPQPLHLYSTQLVLHVQEQWDLMQASTLFLADHPAYSVENYQGIAHQNDYHEWLFRQAGMRNEPEFLARFVRDGLLPFDKVQARVDQTVVDRMSTYTN